MALPFNVVGFNPLAESLNPAQQAAAQRQGLLGLGAGLLSASGPSLKPVGFGQALGQGLLGFQQGLNTSVQQGLLANDIAERKAAADQAAQEEAQRRELLRMQSLGQEGPTQGQRPPALIDNIQDPQARNLLEFAGQTGDTNLMLQAIELDRNRSQAADIGIGQVSPKDFTAKSIQNFQRHFDSTGQRDYGLLERLPQSQIVDVGGVRTIVDRLNKTVTPLSTVEQEAQAAAQKSAATSGAAKQATLDVESINALTQDNQKIEQSIIRDKELLEGYKSGRFKSGPIQGPLLSASPQGQEQSKESRKDLVGTLSSVTTGALSEGEIKIFTELGIDPRVDESVNIKTLEKRIQESQRLLDNNRKRLNDARGRRGEDPLPRKQSTLKFNPATGEFE